jgi:hypothetical protein
LFSCHISNVFVAAINGGADDVAVNDAVVDTDVGGGTVTIDELVAAAVSSLNFGRTRTRRFRFWVKLVSSPPAAGSK